MTRALGLTFLSLDSQMPLSCVTKGKLLNLSEPPFSQRQTEKPSFDVLVNRVCKSSFLSFPTPGHQARTTEPDASWKHRRPEPGPSGQGGETGDS